jgi:PKD repeat protein
MKRLAIRALCLVAVLPVLLLLPAGVVSADDELFEYFEASPGGSTNIGGGQQVVQTFTAASDHAVSGVELYLNHPYLLSPQVTVSILAAAPGDPGTWLVLTSTAVVMPVMFGPDWFLVEGFDCDLEGGQRYAILATTPGDVYWASTNTGGTWSSAGSPGESWVYGGIWGQNPDATFHFRVYGPGLPPAAGFSAEPRSGSSPLTVDFLDESEGTLTSWLWKFGDGSTSTAQNPTHVYRTAGRYDVSLKVSGPLGSDTLAIPNYINVSGDDRAPEPANMVVSYLLIDPLQVLPGQEVLVSGNVCNQGEERGSKTVSLMVNGVAEQSQSVGVSGGSCQQVSFRLSRAVPGTYQVAIDGMTGQFSVLAPRTVTNNVPSRQSTGLGTAGIIAIIAVLIALIAALIFLFRR